MAKLNNPDGELLTLKNKNGLEMTVTNFGGRVITLKVPDKNGKLGDIVLGHDTPTGLYRGASAFWCIDWQVCEPYFEGKLVYWQSTLSIAHQQRGQSFAWRNRV